MLRKFPIFASLILFFAASLSLVTAQTSQPDRVFASRGAHSVRADFDGDGKSDISVFRPSNGFWYVLKSSGGTQSVQWGLMNDRIVPGDFDGDRKTDFAVYRFGDFMNNSFNSHFYIRRSSDNSFQARQWGVSTGFTFDVPTMPADFDGDDTTDLSVYQMEDYFPTQGRFKILRSSNGAATTAWGYTSDLRVPADYDGDGKADIAVFRTGVFLPNEAERGVWFILQSSNNAVRTVRFGMPTDKPVQADYDGDGKTDLAVFRPSTGVWYLQKSTEGFFAQSFGASGDTPVPSAFVVDLAF